ncbi:Crp/Fnr family transcriptional regulator [Thermophagus sp. OGC60D27]|uniref:Crp/Fnr family transcriptional regulator n=1 Tax=Thermophagus sp. OGC60D27 TaxID=3458415 RepID=UPI004037EC8A
MEENQTTKNKSIFDSAECFQGLYPEELDKLQHHKTRVQYLKGETIFKQGAFSPHVTYVLDGLVRVYLQTGHNRQLNIRLAGPGDFLSFSSVFGETTYHYSAIAVKDAWVCMIEKEALRNLLQTNADFALRIVSRNCRNEQQLLNVVANLSYKQMRGKLASALLYLSAEPFLKEQVFQFLTRQDIADFAAISTESTIKFLKEFENEAMIELKRKDIEIKDRKKLEMISKNS